MCAEISPVTIKEVQAVLDEDAVLLEYAVAPEGLMLWAITREEAQVHKLTEPQDPH